MGPQLMPASRPKRLNSLLLLAAVLVVLPVRGTTQQVPPDKIDTLLARPAPEIPPELEAISQSSEQARQQRVSRRIEALFSTSPLAGSGKPPATTQGGPSPPPMAPTGAPGTQGPNALPGSSRPSPPSLSGSRPPAMSSGGSRPPPGGPPTLPGAASPAVGPATPAMPADGLGQEQDGWSVSRGKQLTFYGSQSAAACRADCARRTDCVGYTWVKPGGYSPGDPPVCYLMSAIDVLAPHPCCITATRIGHDAGARQ